MAALRILATAIVAMAAAGSGALAQNVALHRVFTQPIGIERSEPVSSTALRSQGATLFIEASVNGQPREFIFDTGTPTILTREFADSLGLEIIGQNTGTDANGTRVTMDVAVADRLTIGTTTFSNVPVLIHDYAKLDSGACLVDGGIIGSELFPGSAWRIDTAEGRLSIARSGAALGVSEQAVEARLYDFGYPHAPIVDYRLGDISDKALFDTGNPETVTLFRAVAENQSAREAAVPGSTRRGRGFKGESAGGRGEAGGLVRFTLRDFQIDGQALGPVRVATRDVPPTLLGAGILASHIVTLDYPAKRLVLERRSQPAPARTDAGYAIGFVSDDAVVVRIYDDSPAVRAGLKLGDRVTRIDGRSLVVSPGNPKCELVRWLVGEFDASREAEITVERNGTPLTVRIPAVPPDTPGSSR